MWPFASRQDVREEVNALHGEFAQSIQTMQQTIISDLKNLPQPHIPDMTPEIVQLSKRVFDLQQQVNGLVQLLNQLSAVTPAGEKKPVHPVINDRVQIALRAVEAIGQTHATWLDDYIQRLGPIMPLMQEEAERHNQGQAIVKQLIVDMSPPEQV